MYWLYCCNDSTIVRGVFSLDGTVVSHGAPQLFTAVGEATKQRSHIVESPCRENEMRC